MVGEAGTKSACAITGNLKTQITVMACTSAAGYVLPPFVIFDRKTLNKKLTVGEVPGSAYGLSTKGWMDTELFRDWFFGHFLAYAPACRPLLLLLDGHSSHFCPEVIRFAATEGVIIFALPPHTTHLSQPLDKGVFAPLKVKWKQVVHEFVLKHEGRAVTRYEFSALFAKAWSEAMTIKNITAGFGVSGVCPFNRKAIQLPSDNPEPTLFKPEKHIQSTGIKYIPLYSPAHPHQSHQETSPTLTPMLSPVCRHRSHDSSSISFSLSTFSPFSSTPADFGSEGHKPRLDTPLHCGSFLLDTSLLKRSTSEASLCGNSLKRSHFTVMRRDTDCILPLPVKKQPRLSKFLHTPRLPSKLPAVKPKSSGRVLTSLENLKMIEEREKKKAEDIRMKEERKKVREEKKIQNERLKEQRRKELEDKKAKAARLKELQGKACKKKQGTRAGIDSK